jgi:pyruvate oxidase
VFDALSRHLPADAVVTVDVGNHACSLGRYLESAGQPVLMSGYLGPSASDIRRRWERGSPTPPARWSPSRGDGGFGQYGMELTTAVKYEFGINHVLLDNKSLGKISKEQVASDYPVWHTSLHNPDWAQFARLFGATGIRVSRRDDLDAAMTALFAADGRCSASTRTPNFSDRPLAHPVASRHGRSSSTSWSTTRARKPRCPTRPEPPARPRITAICGPCSSTTP